MKAQALLGLVLVLLVSLPAAGGEDATAHRGFPSPRRSREGSIPFSSSNVVLLGWKTVADFAGGNTSANDCWGYTSPSGREYAILGLSHGTGFVEVTDPGAPVIVDFEPTPVGVSSSLWRCVKTYQSYAYAGSEAGGGIQVFDLAQIDSGIVTALAPVTAGGCTTATHTLAVDEVSGFLYRAGGSGTPCGGAPQGLVIYSLANPAAPSFVASWSIGRYVHECQVVTWDLAGPNFGKQIAFCFSETGSGGGDPRLTILDVTNKASIAQLSSISYTGGAFSHQGWISTNKQRLYLNDELDEGSYGPSRTRIFNITSLTAPTEVGFFTSGASSIDHNLYVKGNRIYEGNYRSGLRIFDNTNQNAPFQVGFFDTYPADDGAEFNSLWSNYPYFPSGTIIGGDIEKGLFVWREGAPKLVFTFPAGPPELIGPTGGVVQFEVDENPFGALASGTVEFHYSTGGPFTTVGATHLGGTLYEATLPSAACGAEIDYYVSARSTDSVTWTDPPAAPTQVYLAVAAFSEDVAVEDTMETNTGWSVNLAADLTGFSTATTGTWVRVNPIGTAAQPEDDHTTDPAVFAWVTGQGTLGGSVGEADVDGGATSLRSPLMSAAGLSDPRISYWRWFSNNQGSNPGTMTLTVDISNNNGSSWVPLETVGPTGDDAVGGWIRHTARIADFVAPTSSMRLRFRTADTIGAIVEAAVDDVRILEYDCTPLTVASIAPASGPYTGGNVVTITGTGFQAGVTTVRFGSTPALAVSVLGPTTLVARVPRVTWPASSKASAGGHSVDVTVQNPGTGVLPSAYTYVRTPPPR
jgi:choice-of-anchor B domain-containing protein